MASSEAERPQFERAARLARGPVVVAHLRKASNPMGLPHDRLIGFENSQPFTHDGIVFGHNGEITFPSEARRLLGKYESMVRGVNDSEVLFWLLVRHMDTLGDPLAAYSETVADLLRVWEGQGRKEKWPYSGLNVILSRGPNELWAFSHYLGDHGSSLLDPERPYYEMAYRADARHVVVGSEPFDSGPAPWLSIPNRSFLNARIDHGLVSVHTGAIPLSGVAAVGPPLPVPLAK